MDVQNLFQAAVVPKEGLAPHNVLLSSRSNEPRHDLLGRISRELQELDTKEEEFITPINRRRLELKRLWNSALPIHTLPHELLVQIFADFRDAMDSYRGLMLRRAGVRTGWPDLMLVCCHWRNIIASTPAFWRTVDLRRGTSRTELCLARSFPAAIDVTALYQDQSSLEVVYPHARRFRTLFFKAAYDRLLQEALSCFFGNSTVSTVPLLEDLNFTVSGRTRSDDSVDINLTLQRFPSLQALELWATVAPQDLSLYAQLRKLSLTFCSNLSFDVLLDALVSCMQLEELTLKGMLHHPIGGWAHGGRIAPRRPPISLSRLRRFTLDDNEALCTSQLLAHLYLQPSVVLDICAYFRDVGSGSSGITPVKNIRAMLPSDHLAVLPIFAVATYVKMTNIVSDQLYMMECGYGDLIEPDSETDSPMALVTLAATVHFRPEEDPQIRGLDDLVQCFGPAASLTSLKLYGDKPHAPADTWERMFRALPLLDEIEIDGGAIFEVTNVFLGLHAASSGERDRQGSSVACSNLRQVSISGLGTVATYEAMSVCLQSRADRGARLQVLDLGDLATDRRDLVSERHCGFVEALRRAVVCVHVGYRYWNGGQEGYQG